uniref:Phospholipase-like protein n=1 Tax=Tanacetum cinerariifolium TaxID=118510 RepID=A0A699H416_TANCI|nr:phospholipase-like protein [Tanacetum cinerariifolium]
MSSTVELSKPYDCKVTIRSRPSTILFIKESLSKSNKRLKLFKNTVFGKYLDLDVEDNDNHLLNYVLHHQRPQLSKSIDLNLVFDIAGHTLLFERSEFCLVTGFAYRKLVFPEYMDDGIPPFLRRVFPDKAKNLENKASLGKATQGKAAKGKAAKGLDIGIVPQQLSLVDDQNGFTCDDEHEAKPDGSRASDRVSAKAKVEETKSTREVALEEELDLWKSRYATSVCDDIDEADAAADDNAKAMSVYDDVGIPNATTDDNAKAMSVHDDVGVPDAAVDDNAKATSICDDINEADAATDDNAKATSVHDDVGVPDAAAGATSDCDDVDQADAAADDNAKEVASTADNGEVVKETQLPDSHEDVFQPHASKRMKKETLLSDCPPVIGNYLKEIHIASWEKVYVMWVL